MNRKTVAQIKEKKAKGEKVIMLTAYDFALASIVDRSGVDIVLVGDSLANVVLGLPSTRDVTLDEMLHHTKAVNRAVKESLLVGDMPYCAYQAEPEAAVANARRFLDEAGCRAVKLEWFDQCLKVTEDLVSSGIEVMGHVGLTPQTADKLGGFKLQGKDARAAEDIIGRARDLEKAGCFSIVLECIPQELSRIITESLSVPTIGIGAGPFCDGQVLVTYDFLGMSGGFQPKFVKRYADMEKVLRENISQFADEVRSGTFPDDAHSYHMNPRELEKLKPGRSQ